MPFYYNPTVIKFVKKNTVQTSLRDPRNPHGEALHKKEFETTEQTFYAQNEYRKKDVRDDTYTGDAKNAIGHLCISKEDYDALASAARIEKHDKITSISGVAVDGYKVCEVRPMGHIKIWSSIDPDVAEHSIYLIFYETDPEERPQDLKAV